MIHMKNRLISVLIYSYINTGGNWKNKKLCGNRGGMFSMIYFKNIPKKWGFL